MSVMVEAESGVGAITLAQAQAFVWQEAELLDRLAYRAWLPLWTAAGRYIVPIDRDAKDHEASLNIVHDDAEMRAARVRRLLSGFSMSSAPPARTVRALSRFVVAEATADAIELRCAMHIVEYKYERTRLLAADMDYRLVRHDGALLIDRKVVRLINSDDAQFGIGYLL